MELKVELKVKVKREKVTCILMWGAADILHGKLKKSK